MANGAEVLFGRINKSNLQAFLENCQKGFVARAKSSVSFNANSRLKIGYIN
jgi:hypothetical protein